jgi:hypothetical protein
MHVVKQEHHAWRIRKLLDIMDMAWQDRSCGHACTTHDARVAGVREDVGVVLVVRGLAAVVAGRHVVPDLGDGEARGGGVDV